MIEGERTGPVSEAGPTSDGTTPEPKNLSAEQKNSFETKAAKRHRIKRESDAAAWEWERDSKGRNPYPAPSATITISDSERLEPEEHAWVRVRWVKTKEGFEETRVAVIAQPFEPVKIVRTENEERLVVRTYEEISGTFEDVYNRMSREGRFLKPAMAKEVLAHIRHHLVKAGRVESGRETFEAYTTDQGDLALPVACYPRPGVHTDEYQAVHSIRDYEPTKQDWERYERFEALFLPKEIAPSKAACGAAPFARLARAKRRIVAAPYHVSTNHGVGKSKVAEAYSSKPWNVELQSGEDLSSDFRFAFYLSGPATTLTVDEAEKFDWRHHGANIKKALESDHVTARGTRDLGMVRFPSRRIPIFTSNTLPSLPGPTLARLKVVRFNEERAKADKSVRKQADDLFAELAPVGPALARAAIRLYPTFSKLLAAVDAAAAEVEEQHGTFKDNRRAKSWGLDYVFLKVWEEASGGVHKTPSVADYVRDVVAPVEWDTFSGQLDRLSAFKTWFDRWLIDRRRRDPEGGVTTPGANEIFMFHVYEGSRSKVRHHGHLVTSAVLDAFNRDAYRDTGVRVETLAELGRLVCESYTIPKDAFLDAKGQPRRFEIGRQQRAVFIPDSEPDVFAEAESIVRLS